jgi:D-beta-D-heptose 7-phosphate kinase / D-beta-D-heptose 1-phosphate adenosyltransferase
MFLNFSKVLEVVETGFGGRRILVVGDLMLDRYLWGAVERISPEAPVPVVHIDHATDSAGGAANVAMNLSALGCTVSAAGVVGSDESARQLLAMLRNSGVETSSVVSLPDRPTTLKTRILAGQQQMLRLDLEKARELSDETRLLLLSRIEEQMIGLSAIILSDYGKGVLDDNICQTIILKARQLSIPTFVDPKGIHYEKYAGCNAISPNRMELAAAAATDGRNLDALLEAGKQLRSRLGIGHLFVTLGELGIALIDSRGIYRFPAQAREVFDVSGAGDTVIATLAASWVSDLALDDAVQLANLAAGIVISRLGTAPIVKHELKAAVASDSGASRAEKICSLQTLEERVARWRLGGQRVVFTNGCFDLLHLGHLTLLEQARRQGDCLVVALNTDRSVRALKGAGRPILSEDGRARLVAALPCVDAVVLFDEETPLRLIRSLQPNVLVKGGNYLEGEVVGASDMRTWGGKIVLIPLVDGFQTSAILRKAVSGLRADSVEFIQ